MPLLPGFLNLNNILAERVTSPAIQQQVSEAFEQSLRIHNEVTQQALALFSQPVSSPTIRYKSPVSAFLEALDEHGRARPVKMAGHYDVSFPTYKAGKAFGMTRDARVKMTVQEANDNLSLMLDADRRWVRRQLFASLFTNVDRTFLDEEFGSLTVKPLANGDSQTYLIEEGALVGATAQHFIADSTPDATNFDALFELLVSKPENGGDPDVVCFVNGSNVAAISAITGFIEYSDPDIIRGIAADRLTGSAPAGVPGRVLGKIAQCWIVRWDATPANYIVAVAVGSGGRALGLREPAESELRGFSAVADRVDHPYFERQFERRLGFGSYNRVGAAVLYIGGSSYVIPTGYTASVFI